jgi:hypothetical protein
VSCTAQRRLVKQRLMSGTSDLKMKACQQISSENKTKINKNVEEKSSTTSLIKFFLVRKILHQPNN